MARETRRRQIWSRAVSHVGTDVTFVQVSQTYDPSAGETVDTTDITDLTAMPPREFRFDQLDGSLIQMGDLMLGLPAVDMPAAPTLEDRVKLGDDTWNIVAVRPHYSGGQVAVYDVQVRR